MKIYELAWAWYEDFEPHIFLHSEDKTEAEFKADVQSLFRKYGDEYLSQNEGWAGANGLVDYIIPKMAELGYTRPEKVSCSFFGNFIIKEEDRSDDEEFIELAGEEFFKKAIEHNNQVGRRLKNDR